MNCVICYYKSRVLANAETVAGNCPTLISNTQLIGLLLVQVVFYVPDPINAGELFSF